MSAPEEVYKERLRDLTSRLGFGDNITEPQADNDTIVKWFDERLAEASEWVESQLWRYDCYALGHPQDDDCYLCDPLLRREAERDRARATAVALEQELDELRFQFEEWVVRAKHGSATRHIDDVIEDLRDDVFGGDQ